MPYGIKNGRRLAMGRAIASHAGGFSLLELTSVVAIIALLASISLPHFLSLIAEAEIRAIKESLLIAQKSCIISAYKGVIPDNNHDRYSIVSVPHDVEIFQDNRISTSQSINCSEPSNSLQSYESSFLALPKQSDVLPKFMTNRSMERLCQFGDRQKSPNLFNQGCHGALDIVTGQFYPRLQPPTTSRAIGYW